MLYLTHIIVPAAFSFSQWKIKTANADAAEFAWQYLSMHRLLQGIANNMSWTKTFAAASCCLVAFLFVQVNLTTETGDYLLYQCCFS